VEYAVGIVNGLESMVSTTQLADDLAGLGQNLYHPPTVKGWTGGRHWLDSAAMIGRCNLTAVLLQGSGPYADKLDPWAIAQKHGCSTPETASHLLADLFLQDGVDADVYNTLIEATRTSDGAGDSGPEGGMRRFTHAVVTLPEFHLA